MMDRPKDPETLASSSKLNAKAPEFVPRSAASIPQPSIMQPAYATPSFMSTYYGYENQLHAQAYCQLSPVPGYGNVNSLSSSEWRLDCSGASNATKDSLSDYHQKILNQVEFYFSDINLATTDQLFRHMSKDPEGFVPLSVVASFKKIKTAISGSIQLASILRHSKILVVSEDGKKVRRQHPLSDSDMEELQSRIVTAENLPEDRSHSNLMKIFSSVGSVKSIRTCPPQNPNGGTSPTSRTGKGDVIHLSSKFHAFVEYESANTAEKAVVELTAEGNWRSSLKVRLLMKNVVKSTLGRSKRVGLEDERTIKKGEEDAQETDHFKENDLEESIQQSDAQYSEFQDVDNGFRNSQRGQICVNGQVKVKGLGHGRHQHPMNGGSLLGPSPLEVPFNTEKLTLSKISPVPRMPDGTKGFSFGRGKPVALKIM